ncbi:MAG: sigma-54 dependent transcriptional regulator [Enterobacterales bacterium]|nr:sigma-54 dependent transcriptional regulator [Enterobacterales bacterium]
MSKLPLALIVDDEPDILQLLGITLSRMNIETLKAETITQAKELLTQKEFDFCLTDMRLPDGDGIDLIKLIQRDYNQMPVALITAHGNMETAIDAMKAGAFDFLSKPVELNSLRTLIKNALQLNSAHSMGPEQKKDKKSKLKKQLIGDTPVMLELKQTILKLARSQAPVYVSGESGTGKELVAKLIHFKSPRHDKPFIAVNCGAIPTELMESEFFGHLKGSFTGAVADKKGLFQAAEGGTLFLDEVADLPLAMQVKLLRALQEKSVRPVGGDKEIPVDIRVLSASHKDLLLQVEQGLFRKDLYYRINVIEVHVPALRNRKDDIKKLTEYLLDQLCEGQKKDKINISDQAIERLSLYSFPGNIRELENILERAITLASNDHIESDDLLLPVSNTDTGINSTQASSRQNIPLGEYLASIEKTEIEKALLECRGNKTKAAKKLGISFRAMRYKLDKLEIDTD